MHAPPPVRVNVAPDRWWIGGCAGLAALAALNLLAWISPQPAVALAAAGAAALGAGGFARRRSAQGALAWDGQAWLWEAAGRAPAAGSVSVAIDLDRWMLIAFTPAQGARRWLPLSRAVQRPVWSPLRAALYGARPAP
jgi:hypothetical protein